MSGTFHVRAKEPMSRSVLTVLIVIDEPHFILIPNIHQYEQQTRT